MNDSSLKDIELRRAEYAHDFIINVINESKEKNDKKKDDKVDLDKFKGYIRKIPTLIVSNGLLKTLLYIKSREGKEYEKIYESIEIWYDENFTDSNDKDIIEVLVKASDAFSNMRITKEIIELMNWEKRFVESLIV